MTKRTNGGGSNDGNDGNDKTPDNGKPDYEVGYKKPPLGTRWTSVHQPKRRTPRKGTPNFRGALMAFMMAKVWVTLRDGTRVKMSRYEAIFHKLYEQGTGKGASNSALRLVELMLRELTTAPEPEEADAVTADDEAILADFIRRETANKGGDKTEPPEADDPGKGDGAGVGDA